MKEAVVDYRINHENNDNRTKNQKQYKTKNQFYIIGLKKQIKPRKSRIPAKIKKIEIKLKSECSKFGIEFLPKKEGESANQTKKRRKIMRDQILLIKKDNVENINEENVIDENIYTFNHENPKMKKMIRNFHEGENQHTVKVCKSCREVRPVFHSTSPSSSFQGNEKPRKQSEWDTDQNGQCFNCKTESTKNAGKNKALKFSGYLSIPEDCYYDVDLNETFHNNMHFEQKPFYVQICLNLAHFL